MVNERRNHYRLLHVQREAPLELIRASYRTLMAKLHPDAGGNHEQAARLNVAYAILSDPEKRRAYDLTLPHRVARSAPAVPPFNGFKPAGRSGGAGFDPQTWLTARRCPFCLYAFARTPHLGERCMSCAAPLMPAPTQPGDTRGAERQGRRQGTRYSRNIDVSLWRPGQPQAAVVRLRDLSLTGLSLFSPVRVPAGSVLRVVAQGFDTVVLTLACRTAPSVHGNHIVHARLLTLELVRSNTGVYVNATA